MNLALNITEMKFYSLARRPSVTVKRVKIIFTNNFPPLERGPHCTEDNEVGENYPERCRG